MLVLKRGAGQRVIIVAGGRKILVTLITGARIGFDAPPDVSIDREEVWDDVQRRGRLRVLG